MSMANKATVMQIVHMENNEDENYKMIAFGDDTECPNNYVILQRAIIPDEQDKELGMEGYYMEVNSQKFSGYDMCEKIVYENKILCFYLKKAVDIEITEINIDLSKCNFSHSLLIEYLEFIVDDVLARRLV